jgi:hypothetical protein
MDSGGQHTNTESGDDCGARISTPSPCRDDDDDRCSDDDPEWYPDQRATF